MQCSSIFFFCVAFMCVIGLLSDRNKFTYKFVFEELKGLAIGMNQIFDPSTIISDFEQGLGEAISSEVILSEFN